MQTEIVILRLWISYKYGSVTALKQWPNHRISIPAYAVEQQSWHDRRSKKWNVINVIYIQNDARSLPKRVNKWLYF
jgi:hypothetical protein